ncbi:MAG: OmpH family outer membrane protein [Mariprofundaceae bacterium]|nr:OmpH family outer membrane protein [Mariprofundaceae bacterium]
MMLKKFVWITLSVAMLSLGAITAEAGKIGYIDVKSAVENTKDYQNGLHHLEALKTKKLKELRALKTKINQSEKDILSQSMAMSQERLRQKQSALKELRKTAARRQQDAQEELVAAKNQLDQKVVGHFYEVARQYGKDNGFDLVLPKSNMIYVNEALDITPAITKLLDGKK